MDARKRKTLEAAGYSVGDAADFLEMSDDERQLLDARVQVALAIRRLREANRISQKQLGALLKTSQPRVAKIESAAADVSFDQLVRAYAAAGGKLVVKVVPKKSRKRKTASNDSSESLVLEIADSTKPVPR